MGSCVIISNIVLTIVTVGSIAYSYNWEVDDQFHYAALIAAATYAIIGLITSFVDENCNETAASLHQFSVTLIPSAVLPFFVTEVWLKNQIYTDEAAYAFAMVGVLTEVLLILEVLSQNVLDVLVLIETGALAEAGYTIDDQYVMAAAGCFAAAHFLLSYCRRNYCRKCLGEEPLPSYVYNLILAGYIYCVLMSNACIKTG